MKTLVVYSTRTGNTRTIAEAIAAALPGSDVYPVEQAPTAQGYDLVAVGYWVDKGMPDNNAKQYMETLRNSTVALFGTLGAWPDSAHAADCRRNGEDLVRQPERGNVVLGTFMCQGKVDPKLIAVMQNMPETVQNAHAMTEERKARLAEAAKHPNAQDCEQAAACFVAFAQQAAEQKGVRA